MSKIKIPLIWYRRLLFIYLVGLFCLSIIPLGNSSKELTDITVFRLRGDYFVHMLIYLPLYTLASLSFPKIKLRLFFLALGLAVGLEYVQMLIPYRAFNINDLIANGVGVLVGAIFLVVIMKRVEN